MSLSRAVDRILGLLTFGRVGRSKQAAGAIGKVWVERLGKADELQHWQPYGYASAPLDGAHAVVAAIGSHGNARLAVVVGDRRYTIALEAGEVAIVDDLGQRVHLTRTGIVIDAPLIKLGASAVAGVLTEGAIVTGSIDGGGTFTGTITAGGSAVVKAE